MVENGKISRKMVEDCVAEEEKKIAEEERKAKEAKEPIKAKVLEILSAEPDVLFSIPQLMEQMGIVARSCGGGCGRECQECKEGHEEEECKCSEDSKYFMPATAELAKEEKIVVYIWPLPPVRGQSQYYLGIKR